MNKTGVIVTATDLHLLAPALMDEGDALRELLEFSDGRLVREGARIFRGFLEDMERLCPDAVLFTGDLTFNGERESHELLSAGFRRLRKKGIACVVLPGNHDLENPIAGAYLGNEGHPVPSVARRDFEKLYCDCHVRRERGASGGNYWRDPASLGFACAVGNGLWLFCVDVNGNRSPGEVSGETLAWAESVLSEAKKRGARVIGASHQNLLPHNQLISQGYVMMGAEKLLALYEKYGVALHLSGHMHVQHWMKKSLAGVEFTEIVTEALCVPPCQYGVLTVGEDGWAYRTENVGGFEPETMKEEFLAFNRKTIARELSEVRLSAYSGRLADGMARLNLAYYSGRLSELAQREVIRAAWKRLAPDSFWNVYADSMFDGPVKDETRCSGPFAAVCR